MEFFVWVILSWLSFFVSLKIYSIHKKNPLKFIKNFLIVLVWGLGFISIILTLILILQM